MCYEIFRNGICIKEAYMSTHKLKPVEVFIYILCMLYHKTVQPKTENKVTNQKVLFSE